MMRTAITFLCLVGLTGAAEPPADPKLLNTAKSLFADLKTETLPNGLKIVMLPVPGSPVVTTMVAYKVGAGDEAKDQTGLSHYLEHLLFKGTDKFMPGDIDRLTQRNGGQNNAYTNEDMTVYHFDFAADRWMTALEIEADRMRNCRIDAKHEFQQEKGAVIAELKKYEDEPWELEEKAMLPRLFAKENPYSHPVIGQEEHVRGATAEIITRYYDKWYHPNNATIVIVGGFEPATALAKIRDLFGNIPKSELPARVTNPSTPPRTQQVRHQFESKFDVPRMMVGFNAVAAGDPEDYALDVISQVLTGGKTGRLYRTLIEKEQLCADVSTRNNAGRYPGWFRIEMEVLSGKDKAKAEKLLFAELKKLADEPIPDAELRKVQRSILASTIFAQERVHSLADYIARCVTFKDLDYLTTYLDKLMAVTPADVQSAAKKLLAEQSAVVVWSLPPPEGKGNGGEGGKPGPRRNLATDGGSGGVKLTDTKRVVLKNGIKLLMLENHRLPIVQVTAAVSDGRLRESAAKAGVAALMGSLLDEGTLAMTGEEIAAAIENVGGTLGFSPNGGSVKTLTPDVDLGLKLLFDCLRNPKFAPDRLEAMREQLLGEISAEEIEPRRRAAVQFYSLIYGDHPFGRPARGKKAIVEKLTREDCVAYHKSVFLPNNLTVVVVGDFDSAAMAKKIEELTADWKPGDLPALDVPAPPVHDKSVEKIISDKSAAQTHVYLGHLGVRRTDPDYYTLDVLDNVLGVGSGFTDRLSSTLRDRQGLAYTVRASIASSATDQPGAFTGYIGTFPDKFVWVRDGFLKEVRRIRDEPATAEEVESAKRYLLGSLAFQLETSGQLAGQLLEIEKYNLGFDAIEKYKAAVSAVTPADVQTAAKKHLHPDKMIVVAVGPIDNKGQPLKADPKDGTKRGDGR